MCLCWEDSSESSLSLADGSRHSSSLLRPSWRSRQLPFCHLTHGSRATCFFYLVQPRFAVLCAYDALAPNTDGLYAAIPISLLVPKFDCRRVHSLLSAPRHCCSVSSSRCFLRITRLQSLSSKSELVRVVFLQGCVSFSLPSSVSPLLSLPPRRFRRSMDFLQRPCGFLAAVSHRNPKDLLHVRALGTPRSLPWDLGQRRHCRSASSRARLPLHCPSRTSAPPSCRTLAE